MMLNLVRKEPDALGPLGDAIRAIDNENTGTRARQQVDDLLGELFPGQKGDDDAGDSD